MWSMQIAKQMQRPKITKVACLGKQKIVVLNFYVAYTRLRVTYVCLFIFKQH